MPGSDKQMFGDDEQTFGVNQQVPHAGAVYKEHGNGSAACIGRLPGCQWRCGTGARAAVSTPYGGCDTGFR